MACTVTDFRTRFPEFSDVSEYSDERIQLFIDDSIFYIGSDESRWCGKYNYAQCYLAAHLLVLGTFSEAGETSSKIGAPSSKSAGGVSVSYSVVAKDRSDTDYFLSSTTYGQRFITIRNTCFVGILVANAI